MLALVAGLVGWMTASAQQARIFDDAAELRQAIADARKQGAEARQRAETFERESAQASKTADKTAHDAAALAARIQEIEAGIAGQEANAAMIERQRQQLRARFAEKQRPLVGLIAALQRISRRPPVLSLFRPGSLRDTVYLRAMLDGMLPEVGRRTATLRAEIDQARQLQARSRLAVKQMRAAETQLGRQRDALTALETRQRLASRAVGGVADREAERALALAEQARDLDALAGTTGPGGRTQERACAPARTGAAPGPAAGRAGRGPRSGDRSAAGARRDCRSMSCRFRENSSPASAIPGRGRRDRAASCWPPGRARRRLRRRPAGSPSPDPIRATATSSSSNTAAAGPRW